MEKLPASSPYRQMMKAIDRHMLATDPPDHTRLRSLVSKAFTPRIQYFQQLLARRRADPRDDLLSALLSVEEQGDRLSTQELMSMLFLLLVAGHETTVNLIGNSVWALLNHPEQLERLRAARGPPSPSTCCWSACPTCASAWTPPGCAGVTASSSVACSACPWPSETDSACGVTWHRSGAPALPKQCGGGEHGE